MFSLLFAPRHSEVPTFPLMHACLQEAYRIEGGVYKVVARLGGLHGAVMNIAVHPVCTCDVM